MSVLFSHFVYSKLMFSRPQQTRQRKKNEKPKTKIKNSLIGGGYS